MNREIVGISPPDTLNGFTDLVSDLRDRLAERAPTARSSDQPLGEFAVVAEAAFLPDLPAPESAAPALPPDASSLRLSSTFAGLPRADFRGEVPLLRFTFHLEAAQKTRVMFDTHEPCRV